MLKHSLNSGGMTGCFVSDLAAGNVDTLGSLTIVIVF